MVGGSIDGLSDFADGDDDDDYTTTTDKRQRTVNTNRWKEEEAPKVETSCATRRTPAAT